MPPFTKGGGTPAKVTHKADGLLPTKRSGVVTRKTGASGHPMTNQPKPPRASKRSDASGMSESHMDGAMSDGPGGGPAYGKSNFKQKFNTSAMSQAIRGRQKIAQTVD